MNFSDSKLSLEKIRDELVRIEDSIIFAMIERAKFAQNQSIYDSEKLHVDGVSGSFLEYLLFEIESAHAKARRYTSPDEYPFSQGLPDPVLPSLKFPRILAPNKVDMNPQILEIYIKSIVPIICSPGDDGNYGSAATKDIEALQLISRRVHFGKFVAEAKFQDPQYHDKYVSLIEAQDREGILNLLTNEAVERRLLRRLRRKALVYGQEIDDETATDVPTLEDIEKHGSPRHLRIPLDVVANMYQTYLIPLTKEVEVEYLLHRLDYSKTYTPEWDELAVKA
ncbi:chorismate mutase [Phlyctochytrium arcticum]|nr:chorismate mutase [Phlyctochytrium arcticum]